VENIDYDNLKKRGFLRQKQDGFFVLRTRMSNGVYSGNDLEKIKAIADKYARGFIHVTVRQGIEVPFIKFENISKVENEIVSAGIKAGTSGPRLRTTTTCPGNNWCKQGLINTFSLSERIEKGLNITCGMDLPHKFKIVISGCPNACTRPQQAEIGIHGEAVKRGESLVLGYAVYLGGCGGRNPRQGFKLSEVLTEEEVLSLIVRVVKFYKGHALPRQRLGALIEQIGRDEFLKNIDLKT